MYQVFCRCAAFYEKTTNNSLVGHVVIRGDTDTILSPNLRYVVDNTLDSSHCLVSLLCHLFTEVSIACSNQFVQLHLFYSCANILCVHRISAARRDTTMTYKASQKPQD